MLLKNGKKFNIDRTSQLEQLFKENYEGLHCAAMAYFSTKGAPGAPVYQLAEEAVQETFLTAWKKQAELFSSESPRGWLCKVLKNKVQNMARAEWTLYRHFVQLPSDFEIASRENTYFMVELCSLITEDEYDLIRRLYLGKNTYQDLAQETGLSVSALAMRVSRIKLKIRKQYEK